MILVTGATGFLGKHVCKYLYNSKIDFIMTSLSLGVDLRDYNQINNFFRNKNITKVINCAAYVGGIQFGLTKPAEIFHNNLLILLNLLRVCKENNVKRLVNPIGNCAYPSSSNFFKENEFWNGPLHESVMVYGMCRKMSWVGSFAYKKQFGLDVINLVLSNMYGPDDHFDELRSHALGAIIKKIAKAKFENTPKVEIWGTGTPIREWLFVKDGAKALTKALFIKKHEEIINVGVGNGLSIADLSIKIKNLIGYEGKLIFNKSKEDGAYCKIVDGSKGYEILKWKPKVSLDIGLKKTCEWYLNNILKLNLSLKKNEKKFLKKAS